jgi:hypothetical protein
MVADALTKEAKPNADLEEIVLEGKFKHGDKEDNKVFCENSEVKMMNRTNKRKGKQK